jgi:cytochrome c556
MIEESFAMSVLRVLVMMVVTLPFLLVVPASAQDDAFAEERGARQGQFKLLGFNIGPLALMAQGRLPYDADVAQVAADNIAAIVSLDQSRMWPAGSDNESVPGTRALPVIWDDPEGFAERLADLRSAAGAMQAAAGTDLNALRGAVRDLGGACSACHENYRQPQ